MYFVDDSASFVEAPVYFCTTTNAQGCHQHELDDDTDSITSEASSRYTMSTISSNEVACFFRTLYGSTYVADENVPLTFPTDSVAERLDILCNTMIQLCQGGANVPSEAHELLEKGGLDGIGARVLDLATNSGVWVQEMARAYPNAKFLSLDVKPLAALAPHPRIELEVYDVYAGITAPDASFDLVHARNCVALTKDFNFLLREMHRVLKPGGILVIGEMPLQAFEASDPSVELYPSSSQAAAFSFMRDVYISQGVDIATWDDLHTRLDPKHPTWANKGGFHMTASPTYLLPNGTWHPEERQRAIGALASFLFEKAWRALTPMLQIMGMEKAEAEAFVNDVKEEWRDSRYNYYVKYKVWCARRI